MGRDQGQDAPQFSSGLKVSQTTNKTLLPGALVNFNNHSNNMLKSGTDVFLTSSCSTSNAGLSVLPSNFRRAVALYAARKLVVEDWVNQRDEYIAPEGL